MDGRQRIAKVEGVSQLVQCYCKSGGMASKVPPSFNFLANHLGGLIWQSYFLEKER